MRNAFAVVLILSCAGFVYAQQSAKTSIAEVKQTAPAVAAPRECLTAFREFFRYLQTSQPGIVRDEQAQKRWLTQDLRKALAQRVATFTSSADNPEYPTNYTFIGVWDLPSTYAIVSTRRYGKQAVIDVLYKWGPKTNYPGNERITSFIFQLEDGAWKLDDIYNLREEFGSPGSLHQYFVVAK